MNKVQFTLTYMFSVILFAYDKDAIFPIREAKNFVLRTRIFGNVTVTSRRMSRSDVKHYVNITFDLLCPLNNEFMHSIYFYQLLSNTYRRSFVELHFFGCDIYMKKNLIGNILVPAYNRLPVSERPYPILTCPLKPGYYRFELLTLEAQNVPKNFPFTEGRLYYNFTKGNVTLVSGSLDFMLCILN